MAKSEQQSSPLREFIQTVYDRTVRPRLPRKLAVLNGVTVRKPRLFDSHDTKHNYKEENIDAIHEHVRPGDDVTVVGGGFGVTPVHAAKQGGNVTVYEPSTEHVSLIREASRLNNVADRIHITQAVIGPAIEIFGEDETAYETRPPSSLEECDVLELDCEGAELDILSDLTIQPRTIIVEVHPHQDVDKQSVKRTLRSQGYQITSDRIANEDVGRAVLTAVDNEAADG